MRLLSILMLGLVTACQAGTGSPTQLTASPPPENSPAPTTTAIPSPTPPRTPPALPAPFQSTRLNPLDKPRTYKADTCEYLRAKLNPQNAAPGTVVMIVMLQTINKGVRAESSDAIDELHFGRMMDDLHEQGFQAINMRQLADFLDNNARIPSRSVVLVQDGRRYAENFEEHFRRYWDQWKWPVVNAWDNQPNTTEALWAETVALEDEGFVDHQVYGPTLGANPERLSDQYLTDRIEQPLAVFRERFHKDPIALVWPSGFGTRPAQIARTLGYRLGFTSNARGPVMFNWVPLADSADKLRPSYVPEGAVDDPLMTLPRYWAYQVHAVLDSVRLLGREASAYAEQNRATELEYYDIVCAPTYGPIQK